MLTPGAEMSGLSQLSPLRGPPEVKPAKARNPGFATVVLASVALVPAAATRLSGSAVAAGPSTPRTPRNGMVTVNGSPVSGLEVMGPSNGGNPASVLIIATAAAPACWPKMARATRAQVPRTVTASLPATPAFSKAATLQPRASFSPAVAGSSARTTIGRLVPSVTVAAFALIAVIGP